jgi:acyl-CoA-binding protein
MTKELIKAEIDRVDEEHLDELYDLIQSFTRGKRSGEGPTLMDRRMKIKIDAPEDLATRVAHLIR